MWAIISTWRMSLEGNVIGADILADGGFAGDAVEAVARDVESNPLFRSVGYGGLPNRDGMVELDAGYMDGTTMDFGSVSGMRGFSHPISVAKRLSKERLNNYLTAEGAERYAFYNGFEQSNLLTQESKSLYEKRRSEQAPSVYRGHDTVGIVALDTAGNICSGTSTSGLFMKHPGRVGDSPLIGNGFYCDSDVGGAAATGVGEEIMKGCLSYAIVTAMKAGSSPQEAADGALHDLERKLIKAKGKAEDISVIAMNKDGEFGIATNISTFSFIMQRPGMEPVVNIAIPGDVTTWQPATEEWLQNYMDTARNGGLV